MNTSTSTGKGTSTGTSTGKGKSRFLSSGVYGCVYHPPYDCQGNPLKDKTYVSKIVKSDFTTLTEYEIGQMIKNDRIKNDRIKNDGFITSTQKCDIKSTHILKSGMIKGCKLLEKDQHLEKKYMLLYSKFIKSTELADYLKEKESKTVIMKSYFLICKRIDTLLHLGIIHHDLHFGNIMYNGTKLYIIDFGLSMITKHFHMNNKPNHRYLKEAIFKYSPSWNFWSLEYHLLCYLVHDGPLTKPIIEHTIRYYLEHNKIIKLIGIDFITQYRDVAIKYFMKYDGMTVDDSIMLLLKTSTTWDFYKIALHFTEIYYTLHLNIPEFITLLLIMIHPIPEYRPTKEDMRQFNDLLLHSFSIQDDQTTGKFSKELSKNLKKTILASKAYAF